MRARGTGGPIPADEPDRALWRRSQGIETAPAEAEQLLDLAGFVDERLDDDERERVAALIASDPTAAADVVAARALLAASIPAASTDVIARAAGLVDPDQAGGEIVAFPAPPRQPHHWYVAARWGSLAAAIAFASWLGFNLGGDLPGLASVSRPADDPGSSELIDPSPLALRDITEGSSI